MGKRGHNLNSINTKINYGYDAYMEDESTLVLTDIF